MCRFIQDLVWTALIVDIGAGHGQNDVLVDGPQLCTVPILPVGLVHLGLQAGDIQLRQDVLADADQGRVEGGHAACAPHLRV